MMVVGSTSEITTAFTVAIFDTERGGDFNFADSEITYVYF